MKKTSIFITLLLCATTMMAQEKMPVIYPENRQLPEELRNLKARRMPAEIKMQDIEIEPAEESVIPHVRPVVLGENGPRKVAAAENAAGYLNPEGTLFAGMDEAGKGNFFTTGAVVGAWACDLPCWKWTNTATGDVRSTSYKTWLSGAYPSYVEEELYYTDEQGNFYDSIVARGGWQEFESMGADGDDGYLYWQNAVPMQTVTFKDGSTKTYAMLNKSLKPNPGTKSALGNLSFAAGGLPSSKSSDGLWPLTNAVNMTAGKTYFELIAEKDEDGYVHYFFGSDSANTETGRTAPVKLITRYDKPQGMLYVKSITLALGANGYNAFNKDALKLKGLHLEVKDMKGNVIASSDATEANYSNLTYKTGKMLTFAFQQRSDYDELLHEGFTVNEAFTIEITGFDATDKWGIYSAPSTVHASKSSIVYADGKERQVQYDPYIMLNGIYPTLESYTAARIHERAPVDYPTYADAMHYAYGTYGDTINIAFKAADGAGKYNYIAECATGEAKGQQEFDLYSTFKPYDENHYWLMDIERPSYVLMSADYEMVLREGETPEENLILWDYYRMFILYIYATERPNVGDVIKIGKAGRNMVFNVVEVEGDVKKVKQESAELAHKLLRNNQILIQKGDRIFNVWGLEIQ